MAPKRGPIPRRTDRRSKHKLNLKIIIIRGSGNEPTAVSIIVRETSDRWRTWCVTTGDRRRLKWENSRIYFLASSSFTEEQAVPASSQRNSAPRAGARPLRELHPHWLRGCCCCLTAPPRNYSLSRKKNGQEHCVVKFLHLSWVTTGKPEWRWECFRAPT
jgi:hypothetical protein